MPQPSSETQPVRLSGLEKAAVLLVTLGEDASASVMKHLQQDEVERLAAAIVHLDQVDPHARDEALAECRAGLAGCTGKGGVEYARRLLEQVMGSAKAKDVISRLSSGESCGDAQEWLRTLPADMLARCVAQERHQVIALVLGELTPEKAAEVIALLPEEIQGQVAVRLVQMQPASQEAVRDVGEALRGRVTSPDSEGVEIGGTDSVVRILNNLDRESEKRILDHISGVDEEAANRIKQSMFVFEDVLSLEDRAIQKVLRDVSQDDIRLALKGQDDSVKETIFRNVSQRAAETLKEDLEASGPVKKRDVESAQARIAEAARLLAEAGEISAGGDDEEEMVE